jgi:tRNA(fMet)-specific endonuclease VapC
LSLYFLDTDTCSYIIRRRPQSVLASMQVTAEQGHKIAISAITYSELLLGVERSANKRKHQKLVSEFVERVDEILAWDEKAAESFAKLQAKLFKKGSPIGLNDTMIAGHALSRDAIVITNNFKHFKKVPQLKVDNWVLGDN